MYIAPASITLCGLNRQRRDIARIATSCGSEIAAKGIKHEGPAITAMHARRCHH